MPYFDANRSLAYTVGEALKGCRWVGVPFAGGMSELVYITVPTIFVNDTHRHVINLALCLAHPQIGPAMYRRLKRLPFHLDVLREAQSFASQFQPVDGKQSHDIESAMTYFISQWMGRSGILGTDKAFIRWNAAGGNSNTRYRSAVASINSWRRILWRCNFTLVDCFDFLAESKDVDGYGLYCDPPFPEVGNQYAHSFTEEQHSQLAKVLAGYRKTCVVCRFYDHPLIRELYPELHWTWKYQKCRKQSNAPADEVLLSNGKSYRNYTFNKVTLEYPAFGVFGGSHVEP